VGDVRNTPGRSLYVRLTGPEAGPGAAGKWTDAATGEHGDLLDLIREHCGLTSFRAVADEARQFLSLPPPADPPEGGAPPNRKSRKPRTPEERTEAARRLFAMARPIAGTAADVYLRGRGIANFAGTSALRFHPGCYHRDEHGATHALPAVIAAVTDEGGRIMDVHRTWLAPDGSGKAHIASPRRAMGVLLGHGVRFGFDTEGAADVIATGEGIETMLSLHQVLPTMPMAAATSSAHLAAILFPSSLQRLYVARDRDAAGDAAYAILTDRTQAAGIELVSLMPELGDFNDDLRQNGAWALGERVLFQLHEQDRTRFSVD